MIARLKQLMGPVFSTQGLFWVAVLGLAFMVGGVFLGMCVADAGPFSDSGALGYAVLDGDKRPGTSQQLIRETEGGASLIPTLVDDPVLTKIGSAWKVAFDTGTGGSVRFGTTVSTGSWDDLGVVSLCVSLRSVRGSIDVERLHLVLEDSAGRKVTVPLTSLLPRGARIPDDRYMTVEVPLHTLTAQGLDVNSLKRFYLEVSSGEKGEMVVDQVVARIRGDCDSIGPDGILLFPTEPDFRED